MHFILQSGVKSTILKTYIRNILKIVHNRTRLTVLCTICDQMQANQSCLKQLCRESNLEAESCFKVGNKMIFQLFDPPHLLKGFRNNLLNKDVLFDDKVARWSDLVKSY